MRRAWVLIGILLTPIAPALRAGERPSVSVVTIYAFAVAPFYPSYSAPAPYVPLGSGYPPPPAEIRGIELKPGGRLVIEVEPGDAEVYVDGMRLPNRSKQGFDLGLLAGQHRVDVRRSGSQPWSQEVYVPAGGGLLITVELVDRKANEIERRRP